MSRRASTTRLVRLLLACALSAAPSAAPLAQELRAGFAVSALPAPENGPLAGYGGLRDRRAQALADPPQARALVLEQGELRVALVVLDVVIMRSALRDALLAHCQLLGVDSLILVATHTHSGPGGYIPGFLAERVTAGGHVPGAAEALVDAARTALEKAVADLAPVRVASGHGALALAVNRRRPDGLAETDLPVLLLEPDAGEPIVLFAYGMHPTVRSRSNRSYSADYVGAARAGLERAGWRALFLPGPLGDQGPSSALGAIGSGDLELEARQTAEVGGALATAVQSQVEALTPQAGAGLGVLERWVEPPPVRSRRFCALWWLAPFTRGSLDSFLPERAPIHALRVGNARLVALPAEPAAALGSAIRARIPDGRVPFVVAHANDWFGYAVSSEDYRRGGYESCLSFHGPDLGPWLVDRAAETLAALEERTAMQQKDDATGRRR